MAGMGNDLIREARRRAGLSQRELAERAGTTQSAIARIETGRSTPSFDTVLRLVRLCGLDLDVMLVERDGSDWAQAVELLELTPAARVADGITNHQHHVEDPGGSAWRSVGTTRTRFSRFWSVIAVEFVVIGGLAATAHGSPIPTRGRRHHAREGPRELWSPQFGA